MAYKERDEKQREVFRSIIASIPKENLVYVDEVGIEQYLYRPYARAFRGVSVYGKISGEKYERTSIAAGKCKEQIFAPLQYSGTMDSVLFNYWFETMLLPSVKAGSVIFMDNAQFHNKRILGEMAEKVTCLVLFLPPYSPDLNPIENFWAWLKAKLRKILHFFDSLDDVIIDCFKMA